jgi:hypothetical protein
MRRSTRAWRATSQVPGTSGVSQETGLITGCVSSSRWSRAIAAPGEGPRRQRLRYTYSLFVSNSLWELWSGTASASGPVRIGAGFSTVSLAEVVLYLDRYLGVGRVYLP